MQLLLTCVLPPERFFDRRLLVASLAPTAHRMTAVAPARIRVGMLRVCSYDFERQAYAFHVPGSSHCIGLVSLLVVSRTRHGDDTARVVVASGPATTMFAAFSRSARAGELVASRSGAASVGHGQRGRFRRLSGRGRLQRGLRCQPPHCARAGRWRRHLAALGHWGGHQIAFQRRCSLFGGMRSWALYGGSSPCYSEGCVGVGTASGWVQP